MNISDNDRIRPISDPDQSATKRYLFVCPGCRISHVFETPKWAFNGDLVQPTIRASYLTYENPGLRKASNDRYGHRCHSFVTEGNIEFLNDCTHSLAGKTIPLPLIGGKPFIGDIDEELP